MRLTPPVVVSTTAAPQGNAGHYRRTVATEVSYVLRRTIITDPQVRLVHLLTRNT